MIVGLSFHELRFPIYRSALKSSELRPSKRRHTPIIRLPNGCFFFFFFSVSLVVGRFFGMSGDRLGHVHTTESPVWPFFSSRSPIILCYSDRKAVLPPWSGPTRIKSKTCPILVLYDFRLRVLPSSLLRNDLKKPFSPSLPL